MTNNSCPLCGENLKPAHFGMMQPDDINAVFIAGDLLDEDPITFGCNSCGYVIYKSGETGNRRTNGH